MDPAERLAKESNWTCFLCTENRDVNRHADLNSSIDELAKNMKSFTKSSLRILQWNADGIKSKTDELAKRLKESDIDVAVIQETWLCEEDKHTPTIPGYYPVRWDRQANIKRGGLIFYIRETILHLDDGYISEGGQEISSIRVRLNKKKWIPITNFYLPPPNSSGQRIEFNPSIIPFSSSSLICGDFNAHHPVLFQQPTYLERYLPHHTQQSYWQRQFS